MLIPPPTSEQKARDEEICERVAKARDIYLAMSPVDRAIHDVQQRMSFVRGNIGMDTEWIEAHQAALDSDPAVVLMNEVLRLRAANGAVIRWIPRT